MKQESDCHLIKNTPLKSDLTPTKEHFKRLKTFTDESHLFRYLLKCRKCGQLFFYEFYEVIDWENGNDPQYTTYIPVETEDEIEALKKSSIFELLLFEPRLQNDFPKEAKNPTVRWIGRN